MDFKTKAINQIFSTLNLRLRGTLLVLMMLCFKLGFTQSLQHFSEINIGQKTFNFFDEERKRKLTTEVWYPTADSIKESDRIFSPFKRNFTVKDGIPLNSKFPLILMSHGSGGSRFSLEWLAQSLVKKGYIVASVDHWGTTYDHKIALEFIKPWERPLDISEMLTQLLQDSILGKFIDPNRIGAIGFSFGGYAVLALAGGELDYSALLNYYETKSGKKDLANIMEYPDLDQELKDSSFLEMTKKIPSLKDDRIQATFAISPGTAQGFSNENQFDQLSNPVFIIGCEFDKVTPVKKYARHYHSLITHSKYYEFKGKVGHYVMLAEANNEIKKEEPEIFIDPPSVNRNKIHQKVSELAAIFFKNSLKKDITRFKN